MLELAPARTALAPRWITGEELLEMGDIGACELIDGRIVPMPPAGEEHGMVEFTLGRKLGNFVEDHQAGRLVGGETGVYIRRDPDRIRGMDIAFIARERASATPAPGFLEIAPDLVVEVTSPNDRWQTIRKKLEDYFSIGVRWVWLVEPENRAILVYRSMTDMTVLNEDDTLRGEGSLEGFEIPVKAVFGG